MNFQLSVFGWMDSSIFINSISNPLNKKIQNIELTSDLIDDLLHFLSAFSLLKAGLSLNFLFMLIFYVFLLMVPMKLYYNKSNIGWISI